MSRPRRLDWDNGQQAIKLLTERPGARAWSLVVTHDPRLVSYADRVFELADGQMQVEGEPGQTLARVAYEHTPLPPIYNFKPPPPPAIPAARDALGARRYGSTRGQDPAVSFRGLHQRHGLAWCNRSVKALGRIRDGWWPSSNSSSRQPAPAHPSPARRIRVSPAGTGREPPVPAAGTRREKVVDSEGADDGAYVPLSQARSRSRARSARGIDPVVGENRRVAGRDAGILGDGISIRASAGCVSPLPPRRRWSPRDPPARRGIAPRGGQQLAASPAGSCIPEGCALRVEPHRARRPLM